MSNELFTANYPIDGNVIMSISITKSVMKYLWSVNIGIDKEKDEMISLRGEGDTVNECMTRMRNLLLGTSDVIGDLVADLKAFVYDEYNEEDDLFGGKNAKFN